MYILHFHIIYIEKRNGNSVNASINNSINNFINNSISCQVRNTVLSDCPDLKDFSIDNEAVKLYINLYKNIKHKTNAKKHAWRTLDVNCNGDNFKISLHAAFTYIINSNFANIIL